MPVKKDAEEYNMNHKRRGKAVIFNHDAFRDQSLNRSGSTADVNVLTETYGSLGFEVIVHKNLNTIDIRNAITERKFKQGLKLNSSTTFMLPTFLVI
jgi:caspase-like apoptosis-related cysteine protease